MGIIPLTDIGTSASLWVSDTHKLEGIQMGKGSKRITVRVGEEMYADIIESVTSRNKHKGNQKEWTISEYVVQAIIEKMNHDFRGRRQAIKRTAEKIDDNEPREYLEEDL